LRSAEEAREYLTQLKAILDYSEVSDCNMEEGSLRCDANISLRPVGQKTLGTRTELKNLNSFRFVQRAIEHEVERQTQILEQGDQVIQETRLYDSTKGITFSMRSKEEAHDYRYFPEPDLVPVVVDNEWIEKIRETLPELPEQKRERFVGEYDIPEYDAGVLTTSRAMANYYEECVSLYNEPKIISNWIMGELLRELKNNQHSIETCPVKPKGLISLLKLIDEGTINAKMGKTVFEDMYRTGKPAKAIVKEEGLTQIIDSSIIESLVDQVLESNPEQVEQYKGGKEKVFGFLVGQVMKESKGQANPSLVNKLLKERIS
ncbi:MAG: Asp-tRNA(Asn)/Glu-tRNA(Gln) amidotransferase subunit GatB, partial [Nitrospinaceae bacterium]|nr:Asp-tRNA(Asn)/Glu-tRNA(Gln) amidotransferase subunit GatB [Nitrospinaceae bacterium]